MKKLEFETSKGRFVLVDNNQDNEAVIDFLKKVNYGSYMNRIKLSEITEEQASEVVDKHRFGYKNYTWRDPKLGGQQVAMVISDYHRKAIDSLLSLIDSKGIHLYENPYKDCEDKDLKWFHNELTFYNPYIFKIK